MADGEFMENPLAAGDLSPGVDPTGNTSPRSPTIQGMAPVGDSENGLKNFLDSTPYQVSRGADAKTDAVRGVFGAGGGALRRSGSAGRPGRSVPRGGACHAPNGGLAFCFFGGRFAQ
jgi:hypothetical protein